MTEQERAVYAGYRAFFKTATGQDLINRLKLTEANRMMQGMKSSTLEGKGIAMAKMEQVYEIRTMLDDLSKPPQSQSNAQADSKKSLTRK